MHQVDAGEAWDQAPEEENTPMEMYQIRYFLAVCKTLNFTRVAEHCNVTQWALTRAVQKLEDELAASCSAANGTSPISPTSAA